MLTANQIQRSMLSYVLPPYRLNGFKTVKLSNSRGSRKMSQFTKIVYCSFNDVLARFLDGVRILAVYELSEFIKNILICGHTGL